MQNGAQVTLSDCTISASQTAVIATVGDTYSRIIAPAKANLNNTNFIGDFAILQGYFVDTHISNCTIQDTSHTPIQVTGGLTILGSSFYNAHAPWALDVTRGLFVIDSCEFNG